MSERRPTAAQLRQHQEAPLKSGASSPAKIGPLEDREYTLLLGRVHYALEKATGSEKTTFEMRRIVRRLARYEARRQLAVPWLDGRPHPLVRDEATGEAWPLVEKLDEWDSAESRLTAQLVALLPESAGRLLEDDLASALAARQRTGGAA